MSLFPSVICCDVCHLPGGFVEQAVREKLESEAARRCWQLSSLPSPLTSAAARSELSRPRGVPLALGRASTAGQGVLKCYPERSPYDTFPPSCLSCTHCVSLKTHLLEGIPVAGGMVRTQAPVLVRDPGRRCVSRARTLPPSGASREPHGRL